MKSILKRLLLLSLILIILEFTQKFFVLNKLIQHQIDMEQKYSSSFGDPSLSGEEQSTSEVMPPSASFSEEACEAPPGTDIEGIMGYQGLVKIQVSSSATKGSGGPTIQCVVIRNNNNESNNNNDDESIQAMKETFGNEQCDDFIVHTSINEIVIDTAYKYYFILTPNTYAIPNNLRAYLQVHVQDDNTKPIYMGGLVIKSRQEPDQTYCGPNAGYVVNGHGLRALLLANNNNNIKCQHIVDNKQGYQFLEYGINYHATWNRHVKQTPIYYKPLKQHGIYIRPGLSGISSNIIGMNVIDYNATTTATTTTTTATTAHHAIKRIHAIITKQCSKHEIEIDALDTNGNPNYIHDAKILQKNPPKFTFRSKDDARSVCARDYGKDIEGPNGYRALQKIEISDDKNKVRVLCMIYTHSNRHNRVRAIAETYGKDCDGFIAASNVTDPSIGAVHLVHEGPEEYDNMWLKVRAMWQYVYKHYRNDYDYFHIGGDDMFVIPQNIRRMVSDDFSAVAQEQPLLLGGSMVDYPRTDTRYCGGGSGYTLNSIALRMLVEELFDTCRPHFKASYEDRLISMCFRSRGISCMDTNDRPMQETRYHQSNAEYHATWTHDVPSVWRAKGLLEQHGIKSKEKMGQISSTSVSFHLKGRARGIRDRGIRRYYAILNGLCDGK